METVQKLSKMIEDETAYVSDGHVLCYANAVSASHDYYIAPFLKRSESDVLLWKPFTALGIRADRCVPSPWGPGHPTCNV